MLYVLKDKDTTIDAVDVVLDEFARCFCSLCRRCMKCLGIVATVRFVLLVLKVVSLMCDVKETDISCMQGWV